MCAKFKNARRYTHPAIHAVLDKLHEKRNRTFTRYVYIVHML
jgi:hypothetical protein